MGIEHLATKASEVPKTPHYAILVFETSSFYVPGDERSRSCPGHGYPEHTETVSNTKYYAFPSTEDGRKRWEQQLSWLYLENQNRTDIVAIEVGRVAKVGIQVHVD